MKTPQLRSDMNPLEDQNTPTIMHTHPSPLTPLPAPCTLRLHELEEGSEEKE